MILPSDAICAANRSQERNTSPITYCGIRVSIHSSGWQKDLFTSYTKIASSIQFWIVSGISRAWNFQCLNIFLQLLVICSQNVFLHFLQVKHHIAVISVRKHLHVRNTY